MLIVSAYSGLYSNQAGISEYVEMQDVKKRKEVEEDRERKGSEYVEMQYVKNKKRSGRK